MSRSKWHTTPPPPPSPKILHFPLTRRIRRKPPNPAASAHSRHHHHHRRNPSLLHFTPGKNLFDQENEPRVVLFSSNQESAEVERRGRVECGVGPIDELENEKWMFQAEVLRAECNLLRMEREFALKKLERNKVKMEKTLKSAVHTLVSGKKKIFEGKNGKAVLEKEIEDLSEKLEHLQKRSMIKENEIPKCSNFDKKACILQHRLEKLEGLSEVNDESSMSNDTKKEIKPIEVDESPIFSCFSNRQFYQGNEDNNRCSGRCKSIVRRIVEQVRADTEQWSQMQEMLGQVRCDMEQLQVSRDFWENRAHSSEYEIQFLNNDVEEWREKARDYEFKANELKLELFALQEELRKIKAGVNLGQNSNIIKTIRGPIRKQLQENENEHLYEEVCEFDENAKGEPNIEEKKAIRTTTTDFSSISLGKHLSNEKRMIFHRLKEKHNASEERCMREDECSLDRRAKLHLKRSPLRDIGNLSSS